MDTDQAAILYEQGLAFAEAGRLPEARAALQQVYRLDSSHTRAICALARLERENGDLAAARELLAQALDLHPGDAGIQLELGCVFQETGQLEYALRYYRDAIKAAPDFAEAWHQLGRLFQQLEKPEQAEEAFSHALQLDPGNARAWNNLGLLHYFQHRTDAARKAFGHATALHPERGEYHFNSAMSLLMPPVDMPRALQVFEIALRLKPAFAKELIGIGDHFFYNGKTYLASPYYKCALQGDVDVFETYVKLAQCAERECEMQEALDYYRLALERKPEQWLLKVRAGLLLPAIYQDAEDVLTWRKHFIDKLAYLHEMVQREKLPRAVQSLSMYSPSFFLAYQGLDNLHPAIRLSQLWHKIFNLPATPRNRPRSHQRRVGVICAYFFQHSTTGNYIELVRELHARGDEVFFFSIGLRKVDAVTQELQSLGQWRTLPTDTPLPKICDQIIAHDLDVVVYPEIGLDPVPYFLAHARLAPIQVLLCGHPMSSGIATMDYFISGKNFELPHAQDQYSEQLVLLDKAPFSMDLPEAPQPLRSRAELGVPETGRLYFVSGILFKLHPNHDAIFAEILRRDPEGWLILIEPRVARWQTKLWQRFERTMPECLDRIRFVPWMPRQDFYSLLIQADAALDTLYFGSGNIAYQAFGLGVPLITLPGSSLRSRSTFGLYEQMGLRDCVANTIEEYITLALKLARDEEWRQQMRSLVQQKSAALFGDTGLRKELADFIEQVQPR